MSVGKRRRRVVSFWQCVRTLDESQKRVTASDLKFGICRVFDDSQEWTVETECLVSALKAGFKVIL